MPAAAPASCPDRNAVWRALPPCLVGPERGGHLENTCGDWMAAAACPCLNNCHGRRSQGARGPGSGLACGGLAGEPQHRGDRVALWYHPELSRAGLRVVLSPHRLCAQGAGDQTDPPSAVAREAPLLLSLLILIPAFSLPHGHPLLCPAW